MSKYLRLRQGRKLWGALLNHTRSLLRQTLTLADLSTGDPCIIDLIHLLSSFVYALKHQLRGTDPQQYLAKRLNEEQKNIVVEAQYKPLMRLIAEWVQKMRHKNRIGTIQQGYFEENLNKLVEVVGICERIV